MAEELQKKRRPLVTVGEHRETDISTGETERQLFVKMYFEARDSGLLAAIPDRLWKMLCVLATYIDENGNCYPSQSRIAHDLGVHRQRVNERIQELLAFRFQGNPVLLMRKNRVKRGSGGSQWANNVYQLKPISGFAIFDQKKRETQRNTEKNPYVRKSGHGEKSADPDIRNPDTNKNQVLTRKNTRQSRGVDSSNKNRTEPAGSLVAYFHTKAGHSPDQEPAGKEFAQATRLIDKHGEEKARWIIDFTLQRADETNYRPRHLGAILSYVTEALGVFQGHQRMEHERADRVREEREREERLAVERNAYDALSAEEKVERDLERWRLMFPALHKKREPNEGEIEAKRHELAQQHGLIADDSESEPRALTA